MPKTIKIKKGLNIPIVGHALDSTIAHINSRTIRIFPEDFPGTIFKLDVKAGDQVKIGSPILHDKNSPEVCLVSPVNGSITDINRGEKRKLIFVEITVSDNERIKQSERIDQNSLSEDKLKNVLLENGLWAFLKQRPYNIIANPNKKPRDIFVTGFSSAPLAPSYDFIIEKEAENFQTGLDILSKLTAGKVYLGISPATTSSAIKNAKNVEVYEFDGPHPAGNVGVQINQIRPINKGETVWTINALDLLFWGRLFNKGELDFTRSIAYTGSEAVKKGYYSMTIGASIEDLIHSNVTKGNHLRYISGNVLSGTKIGSNGNLRFFDSQITVIPEGDETNEMLGWALPGTNKFSAGNTFLSKIVEIFNKKKTYNFDSRILGGQRAIIMSNEYDKVFPMDILPEFLIKATISFNIDKMEQLGIYEVAPEDFALCEFVDTSKLEIQNIIQEGLLLLKKEME